MKCEHCGKNEVTFVYQSNVNGKVTEKRLCGACAEQLGYTKHIAAQSQRMRSLFDGNFFGGGLLEDFFTPMPSLMSRMERMLESPFEDFFAAMPALGAKSEVETNQAAETAPKQEVQKEDNEFSRIRKENALRMELNKAVRAEEFERAAQLRDELRALEANSPRESA